MRKNKIIKGPLYNYLLYNDEDIFREINRYISDIPYDIRPITEKFIEYSYTKKEGKYIMKYVYIPDCGYVLRYDEDYNKLPKYHIGDIICNHINHRRYTIISTPILNRVDWSLTYNVIENKEANNQYNIFYSRCDGLHENHMSLLSRPKNDIIYYICNRNGNTIFMNDLNDIYSYIYSLTDYEKKNCFVIMYDKKLNLEIYMVLNSYNILYPFGTKKDNIWIRNERSL